MKLQPGRVMNGDYDDCPNLDPAAGRPGLF